MTRFWHSGWNRVGRHLRRAFVRLRLPLRRRALEARKRSTEHAQRWIAIIQIEHMGDIVASEPIGRYLRKKYPGARVFWFVRPPYRELLDLNPNIDEVLVVSCLGEALRLADDVLFDAIHNLHFDGRHCPVFGDVVRKPLDPPPHITMSNYYDHGSLLEGYAHSGGLPRLDEAPRLYIPEKVRRRVDGLHLPERFVAYHCCTNESVRDWPAARFAELARRLHARYALSSVEVGRKPVLATGTIPQHQGFCGRLSILETAEVISRARLFVGVDSGPAHLANAGRVPAVILLGHYLAFRHYMPYCGAYRDPCVARILHADGPVSLLTEEQVEQAAVELLSGEPTIAAGRDGGPVRT
jgi:heptosyltransferase-3